MTWAVATLLLAGAEVRVLRAAAVSTMEWDFPVARPNRYFPYQARPRRLFTPLTASRPCRSRHTRPRSSRFGTTRSSRRRLAPTRSLAAALRTRSILTTIQVV